LLKTLCAVSGKGTLSGQHNFPNQRSQDTDRVFAATGKYPVIWGSDFGFLDGEDKDSIIHRDLMIEEAKKQAFPNQRSQDTDRVFAATGKYPAIWGSDFGFLDGEDKDSIIHRDLMIEEAKKQAAAGSIISLCWHMLRPTEDEPGKAGENGRPSESWRGSVQARLSDEQWQELITSDSPLHKRWEKYMDTAAAF